MWGDMADAEKKSGKTFSAIGRSKFKFDWIRLHGYGSVAHFCFLCEYAMSQEDDLESLVVPFYCEHCPLDWKKLVPPEQINELTEYDGRYGTCVYHMTRVESTHLGEVRTYDELWTIAPIEAIANLPEKEE